jgi:putative ABC transport system permease protein
MSRFDSFAWNLGLAQGRSAWLAWRTIRRYRARTILAAIGVALISALLFDMLLLSHGLVDSFADLLNRIGYDVRVLSTEGLPLSRTPIPNASALADAIAKLPEVESVGRLRIQRATALHPGGGEDVDVVLVGTTQTGSRAAWTITSGADLPAQPSEAEACPVLITRNLAALWSVAPGATLSVRATVPGVPSALPAVNCRVVGIANSLFAASNEYDVLTTIGGMKTINGGAIDDDADLVLVASRASAGPAAAVRAIAALRPDLHVYSNVDVVEQFNRNGFAYFRQISIVLSSMTFVFAFLLVGTLLTVSTNQRLGEIAALRALGIGRRRIAAMLLWESALIVGAGGVIALPLGGAIAYGLDGILRQMPGVPESLHFFVFTQSALAIHLLLLSFTAVVAASYPIWLAATLPIASTLRREVVG